jgi:hypothetical protein
MEPQDRELFERGVRRAFAERSGSSLDAALIELGWRDALAVDPRVAVPAFFECQGEANATTSALDDVVAAALNLESDAGPAVVLPPAGRWCTPGVLREGRLSVHGLGTVRLEGADAALVVAGSSRDPEGGSSAVAATVKTVDLAPRPVSGMDPRLGIVDVAGPACDPTSSLPLPPGAWADAVRLARLAVAHELVGASRAMLELARAHALERVQFGRPIGTFQAVRHRLADGLVAVEAAAAAAAAAWVDDSPQAAAMAKGVAGRGARTVATHCQQVLAGMGFTTEHPFHRYLRRVLVLDELFGSARTVSASLGRELVGSRRLPPPLPL